MCCHLHLGQSLRAFTAASAAFVTVWMTGTFAVSAAGICQGMDNAAQKSLGVRTLRIKQLEVWKRPFDPQDQKFNHLPRVVEVIASTDEVWREDFEDWKGEEEYWAQLLGSEES